MTQKEKEMIKMCEEVLRAIREENLTVDEVKKIVEFVRSFRQPKEHFEPTPGPKRDEFQIMSDTWLWRLQQLSDTGDLRV